MLILFLVLLILILGSLILTAFEIRKTIKEHSHNIELLQNRVVEITRKQSDLSKKMQLDNWFRNSSHSNFEKLNKEILELCELLIKTSETQSSHDK